ncbi:MAG: hypothetical protein UX04_C0002G0018 [Microgenomates group bacterium GW2011_GWF2_45_18]|nr:MAG: hypothetical protein UW18_C0001G0079 [Microgenomates group bacterium GW2011_GWF1_44_10]KKU01875.1 MAG: hypothetical protein UX04_C0002G0018 [Microgenomates group bacterium GW2011_GWF2_45_18]OGJ40668.1 MAG: hypothetical protein A2378_01355 [Candidatus Pacebacteria bacterium RIFOXYB1_FULL_44_10]HAU98808.1 hypothetical protein [Candidatus Paceibacterota bacterium]HAX01372.1 hypothetical protein [Candidatus Paceibacterota bacterium]
MIPKKNKLLLRGSTFFQCNPQYVSGEHLYVLYRPTTHPFQCVAIVPKTVCLLATRRNRIKRLLMHYAYSQLTQSSLMGEIVCIVRRNTTDIALRADMEIVLKKLLGSI